MDPRAIALASTVALVASAGCGCAPATAAARAHASMLQEPGAARSPGQTGLAANRAPNSPPLRTAAPGTSDADGEEGATGAQAGADPLVSNGLGSPTCTRARASELSASDRRNCETSGFVAAPAPTEDYGIDVHIDTGALDLGSGGGLSVVQDLIVTPLWMASVWAVHALVVMLEWCFTIDLLGGFTAIGVGTGLRQMQAAFTEPWLPMALAAASVLILYHGLVRRRVADTLGEALLMGAMMLSGLWIISDPGGTVGALGEWANQASLGTLAVAANGTPADPGRTLASSLGTLFAAAIEVPWCYLEFGDVDWCREGSRLDPALRVAALRIAAQEIAQVSCQPSSDALVPCARATSAQASALERSAALLRGARSNGAIFLALPANGPARNSINEQGSLLRTLCGSPEATNCRGPTAAQAEFRTNSGTWSRLGGLLLIAGGLLGMLLLLGFVAVRLLAAAIFSLLYLLLAPAMVLAPALGDGGRAVFRKWAAQLLGAVVSKLLFAFLLGVVFSLSALLASLDTVGWWTQWLLMSALWWGAYTRRHHALGAVAGAVGHEHVRRRSLTRTMSEALDTPRKGVAAARRAKGRFARPAPEVRHRKLAQVGRARAKAVADEQVLRTLALQHRDAREHVDAAPAIQRRLTAQRAQLERVRRERASAVADGDRRRAAELGHRGARLQGELARAQDGLIGAQRVVREGERSRRRTSTVHTPAQRGAQERFLAAQAALPASTQARRGGARRDYAALAGLTGYGRAEYEQLDPHRQRTARLQIDRELALRRELGQAARTVAAGPGTVRLGRWERRQVDRSFDGVVTRRMQDRGQTMPTGRAPASAVESWRESGRADPVPSADRSSVMRDAHEVAARRKRQLGHDRP